MSEERPPSWQYRLSFPDFPSAMVNGIPDTWASFDTFHASYLIYCKTSAEVQHVRLLLPQEQSYHKVEKCTMKAGLEHWEDVP